MMEGREFTLTPSSDATLLILRVCVGLIFVIGGVKLAFPTDAEGLAASYVDQSSGWISAFFANQITERVGVEVSLYLRLQGLLEIALGSALIAGLFTPITAVIMGLMYWSFAIANPLVGEIRLSRDLALMGICFATATVGAGAWSLDARFFNQPGHLRARRDAFLLILRLSLAFTLVISALFTGGAYDNHLNSTLPELLVLVLGLLLVLGVFPRWVAGLLAVWMLYLLAANLVGKGLFRGLDSIKREIGFIGASVALLALGADRWVWPRQRAESGQDGVPK